VIFKGISREFSFVLAFAIPLFGALTKGLVVWGFTWLAGVLAYLSTRGLKAWVGRKRPQEQSQTTIHLDNEAGSFPSRHVAVLSAESVILLVSASPWAWIWICATALVAISRLGLREHFFTDVVFGLIWGLLNGWLIDLIKGVLTS
jgi:membrane-associated phospholipid phosphatase